MLLHTGLPVAIILTSRILCIIFFLITSLIHFQVVANPLFSHNDSKSIPDARSIASSADGQTEATSKHTSSSLKLLMTYSSVQRAKTIRDTGPTVSLSHSSEVTNRTNGGQQMSYDVESWLPNEKKSVPSLKVNLTILPVLAMLSFLIALCLKCCSWFRESVREKETGKGFDENYFIFQHGDEEYMDVDFRSDTSTLYDTISSYTSFLRNGSNYNTWNSVRSVQVVRPTDMQALYKAFLMHRRESQRTESVNSYKALVKKSAVLKDIEVQVELMDTDEEHPKPNDSVLSTEGKHKKNGIKLTSTKATETENGFVNFKSNGTVSKKNEAIRPVFEDESVGVSNINSKKNMKENGNNSEESSVNKSQKKVQRFKVSFVTDGSGNVVSSSQRNETMVTANIESPTHSPSSILSNSNICPKTSEN